jgi:hypothetical protein
MMFAPGLYTFYMCPPISHACRGAAVAKYLVNWDNGASACGTFPWVFDTHEQADAYGREWADECNLRDFGTVAPDEDCYSYEVIESERPGDYCGEGDANYPCGKCLPQ